ncbi:MAG: hypothetical protein IT258_03195 [Saprospiraceae bacterium]|nr:hypothetical protein [Saprospiraceae bacterium]
MKSNWQRLPAFLFAVSVLACTNDINQPGAVKPAEQEPKAVAVSNPAPVAEQITPSPKGAQPRTAEEMVAAGYKRYGIEKGAFIFRIDGAVNGTEHVFFDNWGWREAKYTRTTTELQNLHEETDEVQYLDGERRYVYSPKTKKAQYFDSNQVEQMAIKYKTKDMVVVGDEMLKNMGMQPAGMAKVGETECIVWAKATPKIRLYMWQGLTMAEESYVNNVPIGRRCILKELEKDPPLDKMVLPKDAIVEKI